MGRHSVPGEEEDDEWGGDVYLCKYCPEEFSSLGDKFRHMNVTHQDFPPPRVEESAG